MTVQSYIQFIKNEKKLLDEQRSKVQEEAGVEDDGIDSLGSTRLKKLLPNCNVDKKFLLTIVSMKV